MWKLHGEYCKRTADDFRYHAEASIGILLRNSHVEMRWILQKLHSPTFYPRSETSLLTSKGGDGAGRGLFKGVKDG